MIYESISTRVGYRGSLVSDFSNLEVEEMNCLACLRGETILLIQKFEELGSRRLLKLDGLITRSFMCH